MKPCLSIVLLTTGRQPLLRFALGSLLPQAGTMVDFTVSINSAVSAEVESVRTLLGELDPAGVIRILQPERPLSVFEHYGFALEKALHDIVLIAHDDEIYHAALIAELQTGFSDPAVSFVAGGLLKVLLRGSKVNLFACNSRPETAVLCGREWLKSAGDVYPPFCFSALTLHKRFVDPTLFRVTSTSADCLAVTHQSLEGKVYHSSKIFATWLQLPSRNSRWYALRSGLTATWREYSNFFAGVADADLLQLSAASKLNSGRMFTRMLVYAALLNGEPAMIRTCLAKLGEIHPLRAKALGFLQFPVFYCPLSRLLRVASAAHRWADGLRSKRNKATLDGAALLGLDPVVWDAYLKAASIPA